MTIVAEYYNKFVLNSNLRLYTHKICKYIFFLLKPPPPPQKKGGDNDIVLDYRSLSFFRGGGGAPAHGT